MRRSLAPLLLVVVLAAGCGADDGGSPTPPSSTVPIATVTVPTVPPTTAGDPSTAVTTTTTVPPRGSTGDGTGATLGEPIAAVENATVLAVRPGDDRFYVADRDGTVWRWAAGSEPEPVLDLTDLTNGDGEQGLLGLAFSPDGARAYVNYTSARNGDTHIDEFAVTDDGIDAQSRREVLVVGQPHDNHNGGELAFGPDGMLYIGLGDGGSADDPDRRSLDLGDLLGKILRIDPSGDPYFVPADNPFLGVDGARAELWTVGLRNPWRFSFDPLTGDLWIGDVGQGDWEEIDVATATDGRDAGRGLNFGWSAFEGTHRFNDDQPTDGAVPPIFEYSHDEGCSVTGGEVYRGAAIPGLAGWYVFADYCAGTVWALEVIGGDDGALTAGERIEIGWSADVSAIEVGPDGELYVLSLSAGVLPVVAA